MAKTLLISVVIPLEVMGIGKNGARYRLFVQEEPPNPWYVCVLCGTRMRADDGRKHYCIVVIPTDDVGLELGRVHIPVHTDCVAAGVGDPNVRLRVRKYSSLIKQALRRPHRVREAERQVA